MNTKEEKENKLKMERMSCSIKGVIVVPDAGMNVQTIKDGIIEKYEKTPDQYGKVKTVEFQETRNTDEHYVEYWVH